MGKTKSARRREAHPAQAALRDFAWSELERRLYGLVSVQIDAPFVDAEHHCAISAWLVLHLDLVRPTAHVRSTAPLVEQALTPLATLCVQSERLRLNEDKYEVFWRRVLTSDVSRETMVPNHPAITHFTRFSRCKGVQVMLSWQGKRFPSVLAGQLHEFVTAPTEKYEASASSEEGATVTPAPSWRAFALGISFTNCGMTISDYRTLKELLRLDSTDLRQRALLFESHRLAALSLSGNTMGTTELHALGDLLGLGSRRVDELRLERTFPASAADATSGEYRGAFKSVLELALTARDASADCGVTISLASNTMYDGVHFHALHEALATATRPLRALSLADTWQERSAWSPSSVEETRRKWFARICLTSPAAAFTKDCALDLSRAGPDIVPNEMDTFHQHQTEAVVASVAVIRGALARDEEVRCRVRDASQGPESSRHDASFPHRVMQMRSDGWFVVDSGKNCSSDWLPPSSLSALRTTGVDIVRMRFRSLLCDADVEGLGPHVPLHRQPWIEMLTSLGPDIRRLAL